MVTIKLYFFETNTSLSIDEDLSEALICEWIGPDTLSSRINHWGLKPYEISIEIALIFCS